MKSRRTLTRRSFIRGTAGIALALPYLSAFSRPAQADPSGLVRPKRFIVVTHQQGTVMNQWAPTGGERDWSFSPILRPLEAFRDRLTIVAGIDNKVPRYNNRMGNGHQNADLTLLTGRPFQDLNADPLVAGGPSIEQVIAQRISAQNPYPRLDLAIGGGTAGAGLVTSNKHWYGAGDPVTFISNPWRGFGSLFGNSTTTRDELEALRQRRGSVLDAVLSNMNAMRARLGSEDRQRLDAHVDKVRQLENRVTSAAAAGCSPPSFQLPPGYNYGFDDDLTMPVQIDIMVSAMACDLTRVGSLWFATGHDPTFPWLSNPGGGPVVPTNRYDNWHSMVHDGRTEPGLLTGFTWYAAQVNALLDALANRVDVDGDNMLDTTLVMWASEFGNGNGHNTLKIPFMFAGCLGGLEMGRFINVMNGGPDGDYTESDRTTNELYVALLRMFGGDDTSFGLVADDLPPGPMPELMVG